MTSIWIPTELHKFCFKCIGNEHDECVGRMCACLCQSDNK